jgi:hypothetical protein
MIDMWMDGELSEGELAAAEALLDEDDDFEFKPSE